MNDRDLHSAVRKAVRDALRHSLSVQDNPQQNQQLYVQNIAKHIAANNPEYPRSTVWEAIYEMFTEGVIIPVALAVYRNPMTSGVNLWGDAPFSITDSGRRFLETTKDQADPYDATTILRPLRDRGMRNDTVEAYVPEAVRALGARAFRGVFVLVGVAAEALSEDMYDAFERHLPSSEATSFRRALDAKKISAEARWEAFTARFPQKHATCLGDELARRFKNVLEPQLKLFKHNRDDAAHRRATLIGQETAQAALSGFVPFGITVGDIVEALRPACKA